MNIDVENNVSNKFLKKISLLSLLIMLSDKSSNKDEGKAENM